MSVNQNLDMNLSHGSIWLRADGRQAKFLFLTNGSLAAATQIEHPPQVIYADSDGNIFNRGVDDFFKRYTFYNIDGELEKRLESLLVFDARSYATVEDGEDPVDEIVPVDLDALLEAEAESEPAPVEKTLADQLYQELTDGENATQAASVSPLAVLFELSKHEGIRNPLLTADDLSESLVVYSREPNETYELTQHRLTFRLSKKVTLDSLREVFHPSKEVNTVDYFTVNTKFSSETVVWDSWIGLHPEYSKQGLYAAVFVGSADAPIDKELPAEAEQSSIPDMSTLNELVQGQQMEISSVPDQVGGVTLGVTDLMIGGPPVTVTSDFAQVPQTLEQAAAGTVVQHVQPMTIVGETLVQHVQPVVAAPAPAVVQEAMPPVTVTVQTVGQSQVQPVVESVHVVQAQPVVQSIDPQVAVPQVAIPLQP